MHILQKKMFFSVFCFVLSSLYTSIHACICMHAYKATTIRIHITNISRRVQGQRKAPTKLSKKGREKE